MSIEIPSIIALLSKYFFITNSNLIEFYMADLRSFFEIVSDNTVGEFHETCLLSTSLLKVFHKNNLKPFKYFSQNFLRYQFSLRAQFYNWSSKVFCS